MATFQAGTAAVPVTQVELSVFCRNLKDADILSKSDPMCVLFAKELKSDMFFEVGRTETIRDNLNPDFVKKFNMNYYFEESQKLRFEIYDVDSASPKLDQHDFLGRYDMTLGEIVASIKVEKVLQGPPGTKGTISVRSEEVSNSKEVVTLHFKGVKLEKMDWFGKSDPFLTFNRANEDGSYTVVHKTEVIKNTLTPTWQPFTIHARTLCNGDRERSIKVQCYDWNSNGTNDYMGEFITNLRELSQNAGPSNWFELVNEEKKVKKKKYRNSGEIQLMKFKSEEEHTFLDYIKGGMQMDFTVAIDFTASNGNPNQSTSLHYLSPHQPNQYSMAIEAVGEIIQDYDSDKLFPALGFGARMSDGSVHHEFALNFNPSNPFCEGVNGILQAYYNSLQKVQLYGPTNFAPVINHVARCASAEQGDSNYYVLLIITDGVITDLPQTMQAIVAAARLPMSIIIVGVGNADFEAMNTLDGDEVRVSFRGVPAERDIVQFVPFRDFLQRGQGQSTNVSKAYLAKEVLAEIPDQIISYMKARGFKPRPIPGGQPVPNSPPPPYIP